MLRHLRDILGRPDFNEAPLRAIYRRATWRMRWLFRSDPCPVRVDNGPLVFAPTQGGMGGLIHYQGCSDRETAAFLKQVLRPGMSFWDVGAHIGEYAAMAAAIVTRTGEVHAIEADPELCTLIERSKAANHFPKFYAVAAAASNSSGNVAFAVCAEPSISGIHADGGDPEGVVKTIDVPALALDEYWSDVGRRPDVIKVDVEGAEREVFAGAERLLNLPAGRAPLWIFEYAAANCRRFNYHPRELTDLLRAKGYRTYWLRPGPTLVDTRTEPCGQDSVNVVASKVALPSL